MAHVPTLFAAHGGPYAVLLADLVAAPLQATFTADEVIDLTEDAGLLNKGRFDATKMAMTAVLPFDEATLAPHSLHVGDGTTTLKLHASRYSAYRAAREQFVELPIDTREQLSRRGGLGAPAAFLHTLGVNATVETADQQIVLVWRSAVNESSVGQLSVSVSENSNTDDVVGEHFDPSVTLLRGLTEELGLLPEHVEEFVFHSLVSQIPDGQVSVSAHVVSTLTANEVLERQAGAHDAHESGGFHIVEFSPHVVGRLIHDHPSWVPWAPPALIGALRVRFGDDVAEAVRLRALATVPVFD